MADSLYILAISKSCHGCFAFNKERKKERFGVVQVLQVIPNQSKPNKINQLLNQPLNQLHQLFNQQLNQLEKLLNQLKQILNKLDHLYS